MNNMKVRAVDFWKNNGFDTHNGTYNAYIYHNDLTSIISKHNPDRPFFKERPVWVVLGNSFTYHYTMFMDLFKHRISALC